MGARRTRIYLQRHGEVDSAWHGRIYGALDVPLSPRGQAEGFQAAGKLARVALAAVVSSGLQRSEHGAACLRAGRTLERTDDPELRELERGAWAGLSLAELRSRSPGAWEAWCLHPATERAPGGESLEDLLLRVRPRIDHWARAHAGGAIAIVTHGWVVRVLVCEALGLALDLAPRLDVRTGDVTVLQWPATPTPGERPIIEGYAFDVAPG